jgi:hypothetical protein
MVTVMTKILSLPAGGMTDACIAQIHLIDVPLEQCRHSRFNTRKTRGDDEEEKLMPQRVHEVPRVNGDRRQTHPPTGVWARVRAAVRRSGVRTLRAIGNVVCRWA